MSFSIDSIAKLYSLCYEIVDRRYVLISLSFKKFFQVCAELNLKKSL